MQAIATADIHLNALDHNLALVKHLTPETKVLALLKANAYGHGALTVARHLNGSADAYGVARIDEAIALREAGINTPLVLMEGFFSATELPLIIEHNLQIVVHCEYQLQALEALSSEHINALKVWLKIDTGMHRLGIEPELFPTFYQRLKACQSVQENIIVISHLSSSDELQSDVTPQQIALFNDCCGSGDFERSLANSGAIMAWPESHYQWVRPGVMLYGVNPLYPVSIDGVQLRPVMTLRSSLIAVKPIHAGDSVGYGATYTAREDTKIGVVAIGYGDGYPRHAKAGTPVLVNGRKVPLVGRVSMDMITVDLGADSEAKIGDYVELWGKNLAIEEVAENAETIAYELLCNITARVKIDVLSN
ncbi:alanine racemase [Thalassotalea litorea]|uniref:Alanine racemase n=1 Tax=Thalassotalea litorea TaxID=2020715 RepID=A0A5R9IM23_9GAMM|nr:alanine racemase [Thalassotalea litorea]TLU64301.1 alanine racemase [Thalassotalea litorea]